MLGERRYLREGAPGCGTVQSDNHIRQADHDCDHGGSLYAHKGPETLLSQKKTKILHQRKLKVNSRKMVKGKK